MDVVALAQLGFPNAVATLGTACTPDHVQKLFRFTDSVVFSFDGDEAGRRAARKALDGALPYATDVRTVKFLFLPPEHDPDSYIREFGRDAFARYVSEATPLSRFLIEAAREGCDLATAEGRAHLASNAKPLWGQLPEGALKRQLLAEIAELVQLGTHELTGLWLGRETRGARPERRAGGFQSSASRGAVGSGRRPSARAPAASRESRALQILLTHGAAWEQLSTADHQLLCELPPPHGPLFAWLDRQHHDHGAQPWSALREALRGNEYESFAVAEVAGVPPEIENDMAELVGILAKERDRQRGEEMKRLSAAAATDPQAYARLRELVESRKTVPPT
jgi:DNA primase